MLLDGGTVTVPLLSETETPVRSSVPVLQTWPLKLTLTVTPSGATAAVHCLVTVRAGLHG